MMNIKPTFSKKPSIFMSYNISMLDAPNVDKTMKNTNTGTIIYTILKTNNLSVSYMFLAKLKEGIKEDSFKPRLTIENKYPGAIRINMKNAITPRIVTYLLSNIIPIGIMAAKINKMKRIGNFLRFLNGYLNELDTILPTSIKPP